MNKYQNSIKVIILFLISIQLFLYFIGLLRPSIIYDYLDFFPFTLIPIIFAIYLARKSKYENVVSYLNIYVAIVLLFFPTAYFLKLDFLTTYSISSKVQVDEIESNSEYLVKVDTNGSINLSTFKNLGYSVDIINRPGKVGYPQVIETLVGNPRALLIQEIDTSRLLQVAGWNIKLGNQNTWKLDILSFESKFDLNDISLTSSKIAGTGEIIIGEDLIADEIFITGSYKIYVSEKLPVVVTGNAVVPSDWINATIGFLNQTEEVYKIRIIIEDGSQVELLNLKKENE